MMSYRPRIHRKHFSCEHKGLGQYCHHCADLKSRKQTIVTESKQLHNDWLQTFERDIIDLRQLPKHIVLRSRQILDQLAQGVEYYKLCGKRLLGVNRNLIRIPVTRRYRLLIQEIDKNTFQPLKVLSHEAYNTIVHRGL